MDTSTPDIQPSQEQPSLIQGVNVLIEGPTGTGKTYSLGTLAETNVELFVLFTESGVETLSGYWADRGKEIPPNVHWHVLKRPQGKFADLLKNAETINTYTMESLFKMQDPDRAKSNQYSHLLRALIDFPCDHCGKKFGSVDTWGPDKCLAIDSLTGLNPLAMSLVIGNKPLKDQRDWGVAQDLIEKLLRQLTDGCKCHFVLTAHVEREIDQVFGGVKITVSTLGRALAPKIPPMFSDVVITSRDASKFTWSTANSQADLKARNLPIADGILPSFVPIFQKWQSRGGKLTQTVI